MELEQDNYSVKEIQESSIKDILVKYIYSWKWFVLSIALAIFLGFVYIRYQTPQFEVNASILIKDDKKGGLSDELSAFQDLEVLKNNKNIDNEIEILKSRELMTRVVKELNLNISYFSYGIPIEHERYYDTPILVNYLVRDSSEAEFQGIWILAPESNTTFVLKTEEQNVIGKFNFGEAISLPLGKLVFTKTNFFSNSFLNKDFRVHILPTDVTVNKYLSKININPVNKTSSAIIITLRDAVAQKAADVVDNLIKQHNLDAIADKNLVSQNTANFINERINFITNELFFLNINF